jgi:hypothetical protein
VRGSLLAVWRVLRCNLWSHGGLTLSDDDARFDDSRVALRRSSTGFVTSRLAAHDGRLHVGVVDRRINGDRSDDPRPAHDPLMRSLQRHAPQMKEIQKKYKSDKKSRTKS